MSQPWSLARASALVLLAALCAWPAAAGAAPAKRPALSVASVSAPPATLAGGAAFTVTGTVRNAGRRSSAAAVAFKLRTRWGRLSYAVGGTTLDAVRAGGSRRYRATLRVPGTAYLAGSHAFELVACVRRSRAAATSHCRKARRTTTIGAPAAATGSAPSSTPASPAPAALPSDRTAPATTDDVTSDRVPTARAVTLTATDEGGSAVAATHYTVGAPPARPSTSSPRYDPARKPVLQDGEAISYFSVDAAGNIEAARTSAPATVDATAYTKGARTLNDALFPDIGNGGYDARHYALDLSYVVEKKLLEGTATITAKATQNLSAFSLDLAAWNNVGGVTVNGEPATFTQDAAAYKLDVTPRTPVRSGDDLEIVVTYGGVQQAYIDPDGSQEGWVPSITRGAIVVAEPVGAMGWFPNNNVPYDKATYTIAIRVPKVTSGVSWSVVGPGVLTGTTEDATTKRFVWEETGLTSTYLVGLGIGRYDVKTAMTAPAGTSQPVPITTAVDSAFTTANKASMEANLNRVPSMIDFFADFYGVDYPYSSTGGIVPLQNVGYALETQSKPIYATASSANYAGPGIGTIAHETGHTWFGNFTTLTQWKDIWLNEGMTEFSSWLWQWRQNGSPNTLATRWTTNYNTTSTTFWNVAPANPESAVEIFNSDAMYVRGAMTMIGIYDVVGETRFRELMNAYLEDPAHAYGTATTEEFIALVKAKDLAWRTADGLGDRTARWTEYFRQWLYTEYTGAPAAGNKPQMTAANFDSYPLP